ncbi:hypothetical protein BDP55DRAFT_536264, partial [Colletotrichum godetiae]
MDSFVEINEKHRMLICRKCKAAIRPGSSIESHFRHEHQLKGEVLRDIKDYYSCSDLADPKVDALPGDGGSAIEQLDVLRGYRCSACRYLTTARDNITRHWREAGHTATGPKSTEVRLQTWMRGKYARYWMVGNDEAEAGPDSGNSGGKDAMELMMAQCTAELNAEDAERLRVGDLKEDIDRDSSWVKRLQWVKHFGSRDLLAIYDAAEWIR